MPIRKLFERSEDPDGNSSYAIGLPKEYLRHDGILERLERDDLENPRALISRTGCGSLDIEIVDLDDQDVSLEAPTAD
jgi:hypothetical protein